MTKSQDLEQSLTASKDQATALLAWLASADPSPRVVATLVADVRILQRQNVALLICLDAKASVHAAAGVGPPVEEVLRDGRSVSDSVVHRDRLRACMAETFPVVGQAAAAGEVFPENLDVLARISGRMTPDEVAALVEHDDDLAKAASRLGVDSFRKKVQRYRDRIRDDHGKTAEQQARAEECASVSTSRDNQTMRLHGIFDILHGTAIAKVHRLEYRRLCDQLGTVHGLTPDHISATLGLSAKR